MQGYSFKEVQPHLFAPCSQELVDITGIELIRVRVVATSSNLKTSKLNPNEEYLNPVWLIGLTHALNFDHGEWNWISAGGKFPYSATLRKSDTKLDYQLSVRTTS